jgi:ABC-type multidrug transport system ATPase subunit
MPLLRLMGGGYRYPSTDRWIFRQLDFRMDVGEAVRVTGRNGAGKTTLLKVLSRILPLTEGELRIDKPERVAYMDQFSGEMLARDLTVAEQFTMVSNPRICVELSTDAILREFDIGLQDRTNDFIGHLSGGQRQVVALVSTLAAGASVLCLDEYTSSLDDRSAVVANRLINHARAVSKATLVVVTHDSIAVNFDREFDPS